MTKKLVKQTIDNLEQIKKIRLEEIGMISELIEDEIVITINNMIDVLNFTYFKK